MRQTLLSMLAALALFTPMIAVAAVHHAAHRGSVVHEEVVDGVKATFRVTAIADELKAKGIPVPKGLQETHHLAAAFKDARSGKPLTTGTVSVRVQGPAKAVAGKELIGMDGHFGIDLDLSRPGNYGIMCRFVLDDGKKRQTMFRHEVK